MALTTGQKWGLGLFFGTLLLSALGGDEEGGSSPWDDEDDDELEGGVLSHTGRALELEVLAAMDRQHPRREVLDNPIYELADGSRIRPDVVVVGRGGRAVEVREAKDVAVLRSRHVRQAAAYDSALGPRRGTTVDIAARTEVPDDVAELAGTLGIALVRRV